MNRADFMKNLAELLADMTPAEREEAIQYYNDYFDDAGVENEERVIESLGTPEQLADVIKAGLFDGGSAGEFTEKGFSGYERHHSDEVMDPGKPVPEDRDTDGPNGRSGDGGQRFTQGSGNGYGPGNDSYGNRESAWQDSGQNREKKSEKKKMSGGMIALIVILCIFAGPFLLGIGAGAVGVIAGLLAALLGILAAAVAVAIALSLVGIGLFIFGIGLLFGTPLGGLCMMGAGMICLAVGLCALCFTVFICGMLIPATVRGIVKLIRSIFRLGGARA